VSGGRLMAFEYVLAGDVHGYNLLRHNWVD
jgi:hypothetical protein